MDLGILHALLDLLQSPLLIHGAHTVRPIAFRLRTGALGETFPRHDVGAVDDHVDRVPVGMVLLTVLLVQGEHDLLVRVIPAGVLLGEPHAVLGREPTAVHIALVRKERQHLMIEDRVLCLDDLAGLLIPAFPCGLVVTVPVTGARHEGRPLLQIMASGHVLLITEKNFFIVVDVVAQMLLVTALCHTLLFDDRHSTAPPFQKSEIIFILRRVDDEDTAAFRLPLERGHGVADAQNHIANILNELFRGNPVVRIPTVGVQESHELVEVRALLGQLIAQVTQRRDVDGPNRQAIRIDEGQPHQIGYGHPGLRGPLLEHFLLMRVQAKLETLGPAVHFLSRPPFRWAEARKEYDGAATV